METITISKAVELYLESKRYNLAEANLNNKIYSLKKYVIQFFGADKTVDAITAESVILWRSWVYTVKTRADATKTLSACTLNKMRYLMQDFLRFLVKIKCLTEDYSGLLLQYKSDTFDSKTIAVWGLREFEQFCKPICDITDRLIFSMLYWTGIRVGELAALKWADFYDGKIQIYKSLSESTTERIGACRAKIKGVKSLCSIREISLPQTLIFQLDRVKDMLICFNEYAENNFIFGQTQPIPPFLIARSMKRYCKMSGVRKIRLHDLRHSHASYLINQGVDIHSVSRRLGHARIHTTISTYLHLSEKLSPALNQILIDN
jgi:integrase